MPNTKPSRPRLNPDGKSRGKIVYQIGEAGRFASGVVFGPDEKFLFKSIYKYDAAGRLEQETHLTKDDAVINKMLYKYNPAGKQVAVTFLPLSKPRNALGR